MAEARLSGRVVLITGAGRGIGRAVALRFAAEGADLILVGRTQGALEDVDDRVRALGRHASLVVADLAEPAVIDRMGAAVWERWGRLDVLVGNAATLGILTPVGHIDPATWDEVLAVNLTANWRLLRSFDPLLRAAPAGRAIFVTAGCAEGLGYWGAYAVSKAGLESLVRTYAQEIEHTAVRANLIDPGATRTRMRGAAFPAEDPVSIKPADDPRLLEAFVALAETGCTRNGEVIRA
jgi:NAD(P)-dependent dehydrogenase (short-subunit alcohol dehydrogenase family)